MEVLALAWCSSISISNLHMDLFCCSIIGCSSIKICSCRFWHQTCRNAKVISDIKSTKAKQKQKQNNRMCEQTNKDLARCGTCVSSGLRSFSCIAVGNELDRSEWNGELGWNLDYLCTLFAMTLLGTEWNLVSHTCLMWYSLSMCNLAVAFQNFLICVILDRYIHCKWVILLVYVLLFFVLHFVTEAFV